MKLIHVNTAKDKKRYIEFIYQVYKDNTCFKDTLVSIVKTFLFKNDTFANECIVIPVAVVENNQILCQCMYIYHKKLPVLQLSFFEALPDRSSAVQMLLDEARKECRKLGLKKIVIGLNGHVSYGVGLLLDHHDKPISFDSLYAQSYYKDYFNLYDFERKYLTAYEFDMANISFKKSTVDKIQARISLRTMNIKRFKEEMLLFGELCNRTLKDTYLYFEKDPICMYELINEMKPFLKPENLIFAMKDGKEIGFIFWHPDYNEIIPGGKENSILKIGLLYLLNKNKIKTMKINAIGILPEYQRTGAALALLNETYKYTVDKFDRGETNFVWCNNTNSTLLNLNHTDRAFRHYCIYEAEVQEGSEDASI